MPWHNLPPFLVGSGPTSDVLDPDSNPVTVLAEDIGGSVKVDWAFTGSAIAILHGTTFTVRVYAESLGAGPESELGSPVEVPGEGPFTATVAIPPGPSGLPGGSQPGISGVYKITAVITHLDSTGDPTTLLGFVEGPIIQVYARTGSES